MESITPDLLSIYKFEPDNVLMIHRTTRDIYQYFQTPIIASQQTNLCHENLLQACFLPTGIVYKKGITTMKAQILKRIKSPVRNFYEEEELVNTFLPVLHCLQYLHSKNITHGSVCPQNIIFNQEGDVMLRDWLLQISNNKYYEAQRHKYRTQNDDIFALGQILLESSCLIELKVQTKSTSYYECVLKKIIPKFSRGYILAVYIMVKKIEKYYPHLEKIIKNNQIYIGSSQQLVLMYKKIKGVKQLKPHISSILNNSSFKHMDLISKTPLTSKKTPKVEDAENKKAFEDTKRKNMERVSKITQKTLNNQTVKKPDIALKRMSIMKPSNWHQNQKSSKKLLKYDALKLGSPIKRLKTVSRKKNP